MDRVKKMVHYWCDDIKKAGLTGKGVTVAVLDLRRIRILRAGLSAGGTVYIGKKNVMMIMDMELMWQGS